MRRSDTEEFVIGAISVLSNRLARFGDTLHPDITFKQWFLLMMISRMDDEGYGDKHVRDIADYTGSSRQNVKKMLSSLEAKGYVTSERSDKDGRALTIELTEKAHRYFEESGEDAKRKTSELFEPLTNADLNNLAFNLQKLSECLDRYEELEEEL